MDVPNEAIAVLVLTFHQTLRHLLVHALEISLNFGHTQLIIFIGVNHLEDVGGGRPCRGVSNVDNLHVEVQRCSSRYFPASTNLSVAELRRDDQLGLGSLAQSLQAFVPTYTKVGVVRAMRNITQVRKSGSRMYVPVNLV